MNQRAFLSIWPARATWTAIIALSLVPLQVPAQALESVTVTIYRPLGRILGNTLFSCDHNNYKIVIYHDGKKILKINKGHFISLRLPVGRYAINSSRSAKLQIDLKAAGQYFIRPRQTCGGSFLAQEAVELVACEEAMTEARGLDPLDANDIYMEKSLVQNIRRFSGVCKARPVF